MSNPTLLIIVLVGLGFLLFLASGILLEFFWRKETKLEYQVGKDHPSYWQHRRLWLRRMFLCILLIVGGITLLAFGIASFLRVPPPKVVGDNNAATILTVLKERMPTVVDTERRHREVVEALRNSTAPRNFSQPISPRNATIANVFLGFLLFSMVVLIVLPIFSHIKGGKGFPKGTVPALSVAAAISLGGVTLFGGKFTLFENLFAPNRPRESQQTLVQAINMQYHGFVGPFVTGGRSQLEPNGKYSLSTVTNSIREAEVNGDLLMVLVVGSADKRPLHGRAASTFGSNMGLAEARAEWVRDKILCSIPTDHAISMIRGPSKTGVDVPTAELSEDRRVTIYGIWQNPKLQPKNSTKR